jgi:DNA-binding ferritin-like protein (Dps family)
MMNDRIIELMEQASAGACHDVETNTLIGTEIERFAELIVRECAQVASDWVNEPTMLSIKTKIKYHFGVE